MAILEDTPPASVAARAADIERRSGRKQGREMGEGEERKKRKRKKKVILPKAGRCRLTLSNPS